jgi:hypothetical protein
MSLCENLGVLCVSAVMVVLTAEPPSPQSSRREKI